MKILVVGQGEIGRAVAWKLARTDEVTSIGLADLKPDILAEAESWLASPKTKAHLIEGRPGELESLLKDYETVVLAVSNRRASYKWIDLAINSGTHVVSALEEYHRRPDTEEAEGLELPDGMSSREFGEHLHARAEAAGVVVLDGMGFAPGLSNVTIGEAIRKLDSAKSAVARVGAIPTPEHAVNHPLQYTVTWSFDHVLREYNIPLQIIRDGARTWVDAGDELEEFTFSEFGKRIGLECFITPGMPSFLYTRPGLDYFAEKTIRWPGTWREISTLKSCGLMSLEPVEVNGQEVVPREVLTAVLQPRLRPEPGELDVCIMLNTVEGSKDGRSVTLEYYLWDEADPATGLSAIQRCTSLPLAVGAVLLSERAFRASGIVAPEDAIAGDVYYEFLRRLEVDGLVIKEVERAEVSA